MSSPAEYRVLARKYRPSSFAELIGHDTLVRTLANAFGSGRIAHAFMLTGVRGVGKTTTARIIARALNCTGPDGTGGPTLTPCGVCDACRAIAEDRHPDVIEMDAASRTGIDDIREVIESVRYRPVSARYKIYIIDEVHMLSKAAFNALLKTLEEPPPDIKFIFATTEINKVPITVLSRCQRYTLPRIPAETLAAYYGEIARKEAVEVEPAALALVARAADGSVRDGLSILDQAMALGFGAAVTEAAVRDMLGVADRGLAFDLFERIMSGDAPAALDGLGVLYRGGTDPAMVLQDLLEITHLVTRLKVESGGPNPAETATDARDLVRGRALAAKLGVAALSRVWQMLLKGLGEVQTAPSPLKAAEMVLIRLVYVADLPPPAEILRNLRPEAGAPLNGGPRPSETSASTSGGPMAHSGAAGYLPSVPGGNGAERPRAVAGTAFGGSAPQAQFQPHIQLQPSPVAAEAEPALPKPETFLDMLELVAEAREGILYALVTHHVHLVRYEPGHIEFRPTPDAPRDLATRLGQFLNEATGLRWLLSVSREPGMPTLKEQKRLAEEKRVTEVKAEPMVHALFAAFPEARIERITDLEPEAEELPPPELPPLPNATAVPELAAQAATEAETEEALDPPGLYEAGDPGPFLAPVEGERDEDFDYLDEEGES